MKIDLVTLVLALLFVIGLLAIDSVRANTLGCTVELPVHTENHKK